MYWKYMLHQRCWLRCETYCCYFCFFVFDLIIDVPVVIKCVSFSFIQLDLMIILRAF